MDIRLPNHLESMLGSLVGRSHSGGKIAETPTQPGAPGGSQATPVPEPGSGNGGTPVPKPAPEPDPGAGAFRGRFKIASLMPFLNGQPMFRGPLADELQGLADEARSQLEQIPDGQAGKDTMRELRGHLNEALQQLYEEHEPGQPIDKQEAISRLTEAFQSFLAGMAEGEEGETGEAGDTGEAGRSGPILAPAPGREPAGTEPAETDEAEPAEAVEAVDSDAAETTAPEDVVTQPAEEPADSGETVFVSGDEVQSALGDWLAQLEERLGDRMTARDQAWSQWLGRVSGFYVQGSGDLLSTLGGMTELDDQA
jgi:hypothetical protein